MTSSTLKDSEDQAKGFKDYVQKLCEHIRAYNSEEHEEMEQHLMDARSIIALTQLRARTKGRPLDDKKQFKLEKTRLRRYIDKVSTYQTKKNPLQKAEQSEGGTATTRVISHVLWRDLNPDQKQEFTDRSGKRKTKDL